MWYGYEKNEFRNTKLKWTLLLPILCRSKWGMDCIFPKWNFYRLPFLGPWLHAVYKQTIWCWYFPVILEVNIIQNIFCISHSSKFYAVYFSSVIISYFCSTLNLIFTANVLKWNCKNTLNIYFLFPPLILLNQIGPVS